VFFAASSSDVLQCCSARQVGSMTAGAVLFAGISLVYPLASRLRLRSANIGLTLGLFLAASVATVRGLLCLATPYCLGLLAD
jgi:hypothetical protein